MQRNVLIVDDDEVTCRQLKYMLDKEGFETSVAHNGVEALKSLALETYSLAIVDLKMPEMDGMELLGAIKKDYQRVSVIVITGHSSVASAVSAMKAGASDYLPKPFGCEELKLVIDRTLDQRKLLDELIYLRNEVKEKYKFGKIVSKSPKMQKVFDLITRVAPTDSTVLIQGETGTGKELVARAIHYNSPRRDKKFIAINCGALPDSLLESELFGHEKGAFTGAESRKEGIFELADGGTLFLDEIGNISQNMQVNLLRVLQEREFRSVGGSTPIKTDVRVIAATHLDIEEAVARGDFREDLFYRIFVVPIKLPPLRERMGDIPLIVAHFLGEFRETAKKNINGINQEAINALMRYHWPGNVRELENVIERAIIMQTGPMISTVDIPQDIRQAAADGESATISVDEELPLKAVRTEAVNIVESQYLKRLLTRFKGNIEKSARHANLTSRSIHEKMKKYGLRKEDFK